MNFQTEICYNIESKTWNKTLLSNKTSTAYQHSDFFHPYHLAFDSKPLFITVSNSTGKIVGQLSGVIHLTDYWLETNVFSRLLNSTLGLGTTLNWFYGPIIHDSENSDTILSNILSAVDKIAIKNNVNLVSGSSPPQSNLSMNIFKKNNYIIKPWITYITNTDRNADDIYNALHKKTRYDVRKGENARLEFEVVSQKELYKLYVDIKYSNKKKIRKINKLYKNFVEHTWNTSYANGIEKMFLARFKGKPIAAIICVLYNGNVVQVGVANSSRGNQYAGSFLTWNTIRWSSENNYRTFDVGGANPIPESKKEERINLFKSKWDSEKIDYFLCTKVFNKTKLYIHNIIKRPQTIKHKIYKKIIHD